MKGLLFLNGEPPSPDTLKALDYSRFTVCADGAYSYLKDYCVPDVLVGDFDSWDGVMPHRSAAKKIVRLHAEKDYTDGHIALNQFLDAGIKEIDVYGALGKKPDHELANYSLLAIAAAKGSRAVIRGEQFDIFFANGEFSANTAKGKTVSLVPFSDSVHILATKGLKYPISNEVFTKLHIKGISNVALDIQITFSIKSGSALVFLEK